MVKTLTANQQVLKDWEKTLGNYEQEANKPNAKIKDLVEKVKAVQAAVLGQIQVLQNVTTEYPVLNLSEAANFYVTDSKELKNKVKSINKDIKSVNKELNKAKTKIASDVTEMQSFLNSRVTKVLTSLNGRVTVPTQAAPSVSLATKLSFAALAVATLGSAYVARQYNLI